MKIGKKNTEKQIILLGIMKIKLKSGMFYADKERGVLFYSGSTDYDEKNSIYSIFITYTWKRFMRRNIFQRICRSEIRL